MKITFLGTGTSTGVPQIRCHCPVCTSNDPHDRRLRASALLSVGDKNILIDCGPDFREQMLRCDSPDIDAVLITHHHYDHTAGIDDLRPYSYHEDLCIYGPGDVTAELLRRQPYCFGLSSYPGVPLLKLKTIDENHEFSLPEIDGLRVMPLPVMHGKMPIVGYRIGQLSYVTDCLTMPLPTLEKIRGSHTLVINALRHDPHGSHQNLTEALKIIEEVKPQQAFLIHMSHHIGLHADIDSALPPGVHLAFDGLCIEVPR